jgi:hypothetical protein
LPSSRIPIPASLAALATAAALLAIATPARADLDLQVGASANVAWTRSLPTLKSASVTNAARELGESKVPIGGSMVAAGAVFDVGVTFDDRIFVPALGFAGYGAVGSYDTIVTSADGSIAHVRPWTTYRLDFLLPGIGYRMKHRRYMFVASVRTGVSGMYMSGSIAGAEADTLVSLSGVSALLQVELEACRRLDPMTRVCAQVAPRVYDFGFMNGATFGLRVEWGR